MKRYYLIQPMTAHLTRSLAITQNVNLCMQYNNYYTFILNTQKQITSDIFLIQTINPVYIQVSLSFQVYKQEDLMSIFLLTFCSQIRAHNLHVPGNWSEASIIGEHMYLCSYSIN